MGTIVGRCGCHCHGPALTLGDYRLNGRLENLVYTNHLFTGAFHVHGAHLVCDCLALCTRDWSQTLSLEEFDTRSLVAKI